MRLLHITPTYYPATYWGGPIFSVYALNNELANLPELKLVVLTTDSAGPLVSDRVKVKNIANLYSNYSVVFCRRIAGASISIEFLRKLTSLIRQADVVHLTATYSFPTIPVLIACRLLRKPLVWSPRGAILDAHEWEGSRKRRVKKIWNTICNWVIWPDNVTLHTTSQDEKNISLSLISNANAVLIPNGVETLNTLPVREWLPNGLFRLIFMGRLSPKKGIENLLYAMKMIENDKSIDLVIYGTGDAEYSESLINLAKSLGVLDKTVRFAGHVDDDEKRNAFLNADVCIVPSFTENFCMVVAEALGHGVPVIASKGTPWSDIENYNCGLWVDNSPDILINSIYKMRKQDLEKMGQNGWEWMKESYSWKSIGNKMYELYSSRISGNE